MPVPHRRYLAQWKRNIFSYSVASLLTILVSPPPGNATMDCTKQLTVENCDQLKAVLATLYGADNCICVWNQIVKQEYPLNWEDGCCGSEPTGDPPPYGCETTEIYFESKCCLVVDEGRQNMINVDGTIAHGQPDVPKRGQYWRCKCYVDLPGDPGAEVTQICQNAPYGPPMFSADKWISHWPCEACPE